jgi:hypothetical protein
MISSSSKLLYLICHEWYAEPAPANYLFFGVLVFFPPVWKAKPKLRLVRNAIGSLEITGTKSAGANDTGR